MPNGGCRNRSLTSASTILEKAKAFVKPGGRIAYITCSVFEAENAGQVRRFLSANADFKAIDPKSLMLALLPALPAEAVLLSPQGLTLTPLRTGTDGFFLSVLQKS